jgi:hypothetical protein
MKAFFLCIFCLCFLTNNAQVLNQVGSSIKNGATTKAADFNRSRSNKEKNDLDKNNSQKTTEGSSEGSSEDVIEESAPVPLEGTGEKIDLTYNFNFLIGYESITYSGTEESERKQVTYFFGDSSSLFSTNGNLLLNDLRNKKTFILNEESKTGFSTPYLENSAEAIGDINREIYAFKKTGNTKDIMGYRCEEYVLMRENKKLMTLWSALENPLVKHELNPKFLTDQMIMGINSLNPDPNGLVMEFNQYDAEEQVMSTMRVNASETTEKSVFLAEYQISTY